MKRFSCLRVLAFTALISAIVCMTAEAQQRRGGQRGEGQRGEGQRGEGQRGEGQRGEGQRGEGQRGEGQRGEGQRGRGPGGFGGGQRGPGGMRGPGMGGGVSGLLRIEQVQDELKITDDQKAQVAKMGEEQRGKMGEMFRGMGGGNREERTDAEREAQREEMRKKFEALGKETEGKLREILKPEQFKRLKQIELQQQMQVGGPAALNRPDIVQALGLTEEQQESIKKIVETFMAQQRETGAERMALYQGYREASDEEREKLRAKGEKLREAGEAAKKESQKKAMAVLTDEQKAKLKGLMGKFIKIEMRGGFGGGRPGGDRGGFRPGGDRGGRDGGNRRPGGEGRPRRPQA